MSAPQLPVGKTGTPFFNPAWRYEAIQVPTDFNLENYLNRKSDGHSGYLRRLTSRGIKLKLAYTWSNYYDKLITSLPDHLAEQLRKVWNKQLKRDHPIKVQVEGLVKAKKLVSWNIAKIAKINDPWFRNLVYHVFNYQFDKDVAFALRMHTHEANQEVKRFIGLAMFAGMTDKEIAKKWRINSVRAVEALRHIFFDFSALPQDKIAQWSVLRQLMKTGYISEEDFGYYKRIYDLGKLGLEAQVAYLHLPEDDQQKIRSYINTTAWINTYNLDFTARNSKDILNFNRVVSELSRNTVADEVVKQKIAERKVTELHVKKLERELNMQGQEVNAADIALYESIVRQVSEYDADPDFPHLLQLQQNELK